MPALRYWRRYMPVMPASASAAITVLATLRATHSVVSVVKVSVAGWLIWTAMKMDPATAAATAAALVRPVAVMFTTGSWIPVPDEVSGDVVDARSRLGAGTSHDDVTGLVIRPRDVVVTGRVGAGPARPRG